MLNIGGWELMIILLMALVVLGPQRLPEVARQLGQTMSSLRSLATNFQAEIDSAARPDPATPTDSSMSLDGPTSQADAIAATQPDPELVDTSPIEGAPPEAEVVEPDPIVVSAPFAAVATDPEELAKAARQVTYDDDAEDPPISSGGPTDLRDEEE